jgi:hypothetical protein
VVLGIKPTVDFVFKKVFGSPENVSVLIRLLNAILKLAHPIVHVQILNPFSYKEFVLALKENLANRQVIVTPAELRALLECGDSSPLSLKNDVARGKNTETGPGPREKESGDQSPHSKFSDAEMITTADRRTLFEELVYLLQSRVRADGIKPKRCFLSYAWRDLTSGQQEPQVERWVARLAEDLEKAGHDVILDQTHNAHFGKDVTRFIELIPQCDRVLVVGTPLYLRKYENEGFENGTVVAAEMHLVNQRLKGTEAERKTVIGLLLSGKEKTPFPPLLRGRVYADFRNEDDYFAVAFDLIPDDDNGTAFQPNIRRIPTHLRSPSAYSHSSPNVRKRWSGCDPPFCFSSEWPNY